MGGRWGLGEVVRGLRSRARGGGRWPKDRSSNGKRRGAQFDKGEGGRSSKGRDGGPIWQEERWGEAMGARSGKGEAVGGPTDGGEAATDKERWWEPIQQGERQGEKEEAGNGLIQQGEVAGGRSGMGSDRKRRRRWSTARGELDEDDTYGEEGWKKMRACKKNNRWEGRKLLAMAKCHR